MISTDYHTKSRRAEAATFFEETQPKISDLMNGEISRFTVDKLLSLLDKTGMKVKLEIFTK